MHELLRAKANPNTVNDRGWNAVQYAAGCKVYANIVRALAHAGAHFNSQTNNQYKWTPLHMLGGDDENRLMMAELLVDCGAAPSLTVTDKITVVKCC